MLSLPLIQTGRYEEGIRQPISRLWASEPPQAILEDLAANRNALPDRIGRDKQRRAYVDKTCKPNAYPGKQPPGSTACQTPPRLTRGTHTRHFPLRHPVWRLAPRTLT